MNQYLIVATNLNSELEIRVNDCLKSGWMPVGGPYISPDNKLCQAMMREIPSIKDIVKKIKPKKEKVNE